MPDQVNRIRPCVALPGCHFALKGTKPRPEGYPYELNSLGDHIKKKRLDLDLTQKELARLIGVNPGSIGAWEKNLREPQTYLIPTVIDFLGYALY